MKDIRTYYGKVGKRERQTTVNVDIIPDVKDFTMPCYLFIDQSTISGYSIFDEEGSLVLSGVLSKGHESLQEYAHEMVDIFQELIAKYSIKNVFHEETFLDKGTSSLDTLEKLNYIKSKIKDLSYGTDIEVLGLDNQRWKKELAKPEAFKPAKNNDPKAVKKEVLKHVETIFPLVVMYTDDESDAIGMGIAVMIKSKHNGNFYNVTRFNNKLPIHMEVANSDWDILTNPDKIQKLPVRYKTPYNIGGLYEIKLKPTGAIESEFRKYLSHKDGLVYIRIPRNYRYWAFYMLTMDITPAQITDENGDYIIFASRKKRL